MPPAARGPLTLRDFLELGCESSCDGFRAFPRRLPLCHDVDAAASFMRAASVRKSDQLGRSPSRSPSSLFLRSPGALARISSLSRSFSRRITFWRRRRDCHYIDDDGDEKVLCFDDEERESCGLPSPLVSSCSASSDSDSEYAALEPGVALAEEELASSAPATEEASSSSASSAADHGDSCCSCTDAPGAAGDDGREKALLDAGDPAVVDREEEKQQLSPVSALDFPFDDDDGEEEEASDAGTCSPSRFQRTTTAKQAQALHKIRRLDGLAEAVRPVDLDDARFATATTSESVRSESVGDDAHSSCTPRLATTSTSCTSDDDTAATTTTSTASRSRHDGEDAAEQCIEIGIEAGKELPPEHRLLWRLLEDADGDTCAVDDEATELLLLDFFADGLDRRIRSAAAGSSSALKTLPRLLDDDRKAAALVHATRDWLRGAGPQWGIADVVRSSEAALADMERGRRWTRARDEAEERAVGAEVEALVTDALVDELVAELAASSSWCGDRRPN